MAEHPHEHPHPHAPGSGVDDGLSVAEYWEQQYAVPRWSGNANAALEAVMPLLGDATDAVDLGCGEGGDAIRLAEAGWRVTAVDISPTAVERGRAVAVERGVGAAISWVAADLETWTVPAGTRLVTASFLQSNRQLDREGILRRAAAAIAPGGRLLVVAHAEMPPWSPHAGELGITPDTELAGLTLDPSAWETEVAQLRPRVVSGPDGAVATIRDSVLLVRRVA